MKLKQKSRLYFAHLYVNQEPLVNKKQNINMKIILIQQIVKWTLLFKLKKCEQAYLYSDIIIEILIEFLSIP